MEYRKIRKEDEHIFHTLLEAYYREGEDADTPQEALDSFIGFLFSQAMSAPTSRPSPFGTAAVIPTAARWQTTVCRS